jgi:hypothetical protein
MEDGSTYYTLGYYPENKDWNSAFRKIQIKLQRNGVKLRYRIGAVGRCGRSCPGHGLGACGGDGTRAGR